MVLPDSVESAEGLAGEEGSDLEEPPKVDLTSFVKTPTLCKCVCMYVCMYVYWCRRLIILIFDDAFKSKA